MTRPNRFDNQEGIVIHGKAYTRSQVLGIKSECYLVLRRSTHPPHVLEKYDSTRSPSGVVIVLKNVIVNSSGKRGFVLISGGSVLHHFVLESEAVAALWIKNLQKLSSFEPLNSEELYSDVVPCGLSLSLLPSTALNYHGRCYLVVSDRDICLHGSGDSGAQIVVSWPLNAIRSYGISKKLFTLKTGRSTVTGRAEFIFEVSKPLTPFHIYQEVAAKVCSSHTTTNEISNSTPTAIDVEPAVETEILADEADGYETCDRPASYESLPDVTSPSGAAPGGIAPGGTAPDETAPGGTTPGGTTPGGTTPDELHTDSDEGLVKDVVYTQLPLMHSITCQLPSKSFLTVSGLDDSVRSLRSLLERESRFKNCSVLLYGPPNSGKRTLANALSMEFEARFVCLDCASLASKLGVDELDDLREAFDCVLTLRPCVVLLEHVDVLTHGFERSELGFSVLRAIMDLLDRASANPRLVVVCSIVRPEGVADSLLTRLTEQIYVPLPSETTRSRVFMDRLRLLTTLNDGGEFAKALVSSTCGCSVAQILELCSEVERVWRTGEGARSCATEERIRELRRVSFGWLSENVVPLTGSQAELVEASANYFVKRNAAQGDTFLVTLESNPVLPSIHACFLKITSSGLELRDLDPSHLIVSWSRKTIRGFGTAVNLFRLETGRSSPTGAAFFNFKTKEPDAIQRTIETIYSNRRDHPESSAPTLEYAL